MSEPANSNPYASDGEQPTKSTLEITVRVVVLGLILSVVMGAANVYVGLKAGMTVSASIPAAVMAMLLFKLLFKNSTTLEANQVQTCASAGESLAAGIIFTMPAMIMIGYWDTFDFWSVSIIALTGGLLGILFMIPMRKVFVVNNKDLIYPEGIACAAVLRAGEKREDDDQSDGKSLVAGGILGAAFALLVKYIGIVSSTLEGATLAGGRLLFFGGDMSPMLVAVGFIVRLNVAVLIFLGGAISWLLAIPFFEELQVVSTYVETALAKFVTALGVEMAAPAAVEPGTVSNMLAESGTVDTAYGLWSTKIRYIGVGAMIVGGFSSLIAVRSGLFAAISELWANITNPPKSADDRQRDIPSIAILFLLLGCVAMLAIVNYRFTNGLGITVLATAVMLVMGFFFTAVASYIVGLVGNSNSPVSGMTITSVLVAGGLLWLFNYSGMDAMVATLGIAAIVCCVACTSGDVCNDLKTGSMVGAAPFRQQMMQIAGVLVAAFVMAPVLTLLHENTPGGIGGKELSAPQAGLFKALAEGFAGEGKLEWGMIGIGAIVGAVILAIDTALKSSGARFRAHLMPIAVGMYLPFGLATPILIGGILAHFWSRKTPHDQHDKVLHRGVLFSSGVIAGEALTAVGLACLAAMEVNALELGLSKVLVTVASIIGALAIVVCFAMATRPKN